MNGIFDAPGFWKAKGIKSIKLWKGVVGEYYVWIELPDRFDERFPVLDKARLDPRACG